MNISKAATQVQCVLNDVVLHGECALKKPGRTEWRDIDRFRFTVQDQFRHACANSGTLHEPMTRETGCDRQSARLAEKTEHWIVIGRYFIKSCPATQDVRLF